jgi:hypothetical protein
VPFGETFHGDTVYPLEKRIVEVVRERGSPPQQEERYSVTLKKEGEDAVVIKKGKTALVTERIATIEGKEGKWRVSHRDEPLSSEEKVFEVLDGCVISEVGSRRKFTVTDVEDETVTLEKENKHALRVSSE